ncbi:hypothetical protein DPMN_100416 [Dreissena polymorpha]|uniref:Uncharacterized protein n=1 Tax=Dreissena polymorpha TaxID=45954 RepID=A0A9D4LJ74_DREPO|nr:hypothetical protein DPMN_100416 [Dreissena polymorpha]
MDDAEKVDFKLDDKAILAIVKAVEDSIGSSFSMKMKSMVESIVSGVVDGLSKEAVYSFFSLICALAPVNFLNLRCMA